MLSALEDACGSFPQAIEICERLLRARGHVYPSTLERVYLEAVTRDGRTIEGQAVACHSRTALERVALRSDGPIRPYEPALAAIREADLVVLGPGSLFTSIIPNLLVPGVAEAIRESKAATLFVCSLADMQGETWGLTAKEHVEALLAHGMEGALDYVLVHSPEPLRPDNMASGVFNAATGNDADRSPIGQMGDLELSGRIRPVRVTYQDVRAIQESGGPLMVVRNLVDPMHPTWHSPTALREAFAGVIRLCRSRQR